MSGEKITLNKDDLIRAMIAAKLPQSACRTAQTMLPPGEFTEDFFVGIAKTKPSGRVRSSPGRGKRLLAAQ